MAISTDLTTLDFDLIKENLKNYLRSQSIFKDYDFESSNINVLLDVLAYNSYLNSFYLNMIGNEMFLDSALLRDSVVSHAKELNYLPRSFRSARANVNITIVDTENSTVFIPRGTTFTGTNGQKDFTFVTSENITVNSTQEPNIFVANNVLLFEGDYVSDSYVVSQTQSNRYVITNKTVDITSVLVTVIEDNGANVLEYRRRDSLFDIGALDQVFFIQPAENDTYEIVFGDGVIGRPPKDRSIVLIQYRATNGELPNGISVFSADGTINGGLITNVTVNQAASGGAISESISSIKFNAPRAFTTQERVVTARDYNTLLINQFPEINDVSAYGGEESNPPQFGKVIIAVDLRNSDDLPPSRRTEYASFIKQRSPLSIDPVFVKPDFTYIKVNSKVRYSINQTQLTVSDIRTIVESTIQNFDALNLNGFNKTLRYSRLIAAIDNSQTSIISNDTEVLAIKTVTPTIGINANYDVEFGISFLDNISLLPNTRDINEISVISSSPFIYQGVECFFEDDGEGTLRIMAQDNSQFIFIQNIGTVNYDTGFIQIKDFSPQALINNKIDIYARALDSDITSQRRTILRIRPEDITVDIEQVRQ